MSPIVDDSTADVVRCVCNTVVLCAGDPLDLAVGLSPPPILLGVSPPLPTMRETIFSSEVHSVEYEKHGMDVSVGGTIFFDDIGELFSL